MLDPTTIHLAFIVGAVVSALCALIGLAIHIALTPLRNRLLDPKHNRSVVLYTLAAALAVGVSAAFAVTAFTEGSFIYMLISVVFFYLTIELARPAMMTSRKMRYGVWP